MKKELRNWLNTLVQRQNSKAIEITKYIEELESIEATSKQTHELYTSEDQYKCIALSTSHLDKDSCKALEELSDNSHMVFERDTGWFVKLYDELDYNLELPSGGRNIDKFPSQLTKIYTSALSAGFRMIEFDQDAQVHDSFETF